MSEERSDRRCGDCGAALELLAPACPDCGAASPATPASCRDCGTPVDHAEPGTCPDCHAAVSPWDVVVRRVREAGYHVPLVVSDGAPHPVAAGFEPGRGKPAGQRADYRRALADGTEVHVRVYGDHYEAHLDRRSAEDRLAHLARDAPLETAAGTTVLSLLLLAVRRFRGGSGGRAPLTGAASARAASARVASARAASTRAASERAASARTHLRALVARAATGLPALPLPALLRRRGSS